MLLTHQCLSLCQFQRELGGCSGETSSAVRPSLPSLSSVGPQPAVVSALYYYPPSADHYQSCPLHHVTLRNNNIICTLVYQNCSANRAKAGFKNSIFKIQFNFSIQLNKSFVDQQQPLVMPEVEKQNY